ncbi:hypothetical protein PHIN9_13140 [Polynucleobacter sp. HIN9]|nr:hypothetical protein PHIN9_13140 [Polynucleobacter sp. HIN9]
MELMAPLVAEAVTTIPPRRFSRAVLVAMQPMEIALPLEILEVLLMDPLVAAVVVQAQLV